MHKSPSAAAESQLQRIPGRVQHMCRSSRHMQLCHPARAELSNHSTSFQAATLKVCCTMQQSRACSPAAGCWDCSAQVLPCSRPPTCWGHFLRDTNEQKLATPVRTPSCLSAIPLPTFLDTCCWGSDNFLSSWSSSPGSSPWSEPASSDGSSSEATHMCCQHKDIQTTTCTCNSLGLPLLCTVVQEALQTLQHADKACRAGPIHSSLARYCRAGCQPCRRLFAVIWLERRSPVAVWYPKGAGLTPTAQALGDMSHRLVLQRQAIWPCLESQLSKLTGQPRCPGCAGWQAL